jgi:hypothetical protein
MPQLLFRRKKPICKACSADAAHRPVHPAVTLPVSYTPPSLLQDLHVLDLLELAGSQSKAGLALAMHQSTVCRSLRLMQQELRLQPATGPTVCRQGHNDCLHHLRLAYRAHRLLDGVMRIGTDLLHQPLIEPLAQVQQVPPRFRSAEQWVELIRHGLLDGAILSSLALELRLLSGKVPRWEGIGAKPLGTLGLQLMADAPDRRRVLLPNRPTAPGLHQAVSAAGLSIEVQPTACQDTAAWLKRSRDRQLALPLSPALMEQTWLKHNGLVPLQVQPPLIEQLWLILPVGSGNNQTIRQVLRHLKSQVVEIESSRQKRTETHTDQNQNNEPMSSIDDQND